MVAPPIQRSWINVLFASVDSLLILGGILLGGVARSAEATRYIHHVEDFPWKVVTFLCVVQITFYCFNLYAVRNFREKLRLMTILIEALTFSAVLLTIVYYLIPFLETGRAVMAISLILIYFLTFGWRVLYSWLTKHMGFKERILIIGTGNTARKTAQEIFKNGQDDFEIVGFVDEGRDGGKSLWPRGSGRP